MVDRRDDYTDGSGFRRASSLTGAGVPQDDPIEDDSEEQSPLERRR